MHRLRLVLETKLQLEEVDFRLLGYKVIDETKGVNLVTEAVVWWDLHNDWRLGSWLLDVTEWEVFAVFGKIVVLGGSVDTADFEVSAVSAKWCFKINFIASQIVVTNKGLSWLVDIE